MERAPHKSLPHCHHGFALAIALILMAFLLLLTLSLSTLLNVENQNASAANTRLRAKENALLGLKVALGELQRLTGPDQRTTGRASFTDSDTETFDDDDVNEPYWIGVWDEDGNLLSWLVSGNAGLSPSEEGFMTPADSGADWITMNANDTVHVPLVSLDDGGFAYWIDDEGVKAKITPIDTSTQDTLAASSQQMGIAEITDLDWLTTISDSARSKATSVGSLAILAPDNDAANALELHTLDLTTHSYGLLSNSQDGGLQQDLTLALYDSNQMPTGQIFGPIGGNASRTYPGGPQWSQLQSWILAAPSDGEDLPVRATTDSVAGFFPVVTQVQIYVLPRYEPTSPYPVHLEIFPAVVLWNPYDRALETTDYRIDIGRAMRDLTYATRKDNRFGSIFDDWEISLDGATEEDFLDSTTNIEAGLSFNLPNVRLEAGESLAFSPPSGSQQLGTFSRDDVPTAGTNELEPGYHSNGVFWIPTRIELGAELAADEIFSAPDFVMLAHQSESIGFRLCKQDGTLLTQAVHMAGYTVSAAATPIQATTGVPIDMAGSIGIKLVRNFVDSGDDTVKWLAQLNPRAVTQGPTPFIYNSFSSVDDIVKSNINNPSFYSSYHLDGLEMGTGLPATGSNSGSGFNTNSSYIDDTVLFESPPERNNLHGIGQLMHAPLYYARDTRTDIDESLLYRLEWGRFDNHQPAYAIGNSQADCRIPLDQLYSNWQDYPPQVDQRYLTFNSVHYDYSYLLNDALWDAYFFSTLPSSTSRSPTNNRICALYPNDTTSLTSKTVATEFLIDGAFNINSTSEEAWKALLASYFGKELMDGQPEGSPYVRITDSLGTAFDSSTDDIESEAAYHGYRTLTSDQINNLARQIVKEVKRRGPFISLSSFINRNPNEDAPDYLDSDAFRLEGTLAAAIRAADSITAEEANDLGITQQSGCINTPLQDSDFATSPHGTSGYISDAETGWKSEALPGWLTQADLLARLGPILRARSDTFRIRAYGEVRNPFTGDVEAHAWCEAYVQRLPEYIDSSESPETQTDSLNISDNQNFGRRYVVVDFHWLDDAL